MYDRLCSNGHQMIDCWEKIDTKNVQCTQCGADTERAWLTRPGNVIGDDIPGGYIVRHGLCNEDGTPRKYYSKSEIHAEAKRRGLVNIVEHKPDPMSGSDKAKHTTRWV